MSLVKHESIREWNIRTKTTHGGRNTKLYRVWINMKSRCYNPNHKSYKDYGARGIKVCSEWLNDFGAFRQWSFDNGYSDSLTLDRADTNGHYEPSNCRWVSMKIQERNRRNNHKVFYKGKEYTLSELAEIANISWECLYSRIFHSHWSIEEAVTTPLRRRRSNGR